MRDTPESFRFLDLPAELRLMVYEYLPIRTNRVTFVQTSKHALPISSFSLITTLPPSTAILATCRLINGEAKATLRATAQRYLEGGPMAGPAPRIEADVDALMTLSASNGLLSKVSVLYSVLKTTSRRQPRRSARTSNMKNVASSIMTKGYRLEVGAAKTELQELVQFADVAAYALCHQDRRIRNEELRGSADQQTARHKARLARSPQIQVALRKQPEVDIMSFFRDLYACSYCLNRALMSQAASYVLHLLRDDATSAVDQQEFFKLMSDCVQRQPWLTDVIIGQNNFNKDNKEVYDTLWKDSGEN